eukprot:gene24515-10118_t
MEVNTPDQPMESQSITSNDVLEGIRAQGKELTSLEQSQRPQVMNDYGFIDDPDNIEAETLSATLATNMDEVLLNHNAEQAAAVKGIQCHEFPAIKTPLSAADMSTSTHSLCEEVADVLANMKMVSRKNDMKYLCRKN